MEYYVALKSEAVLFCIEIPKVTKKYCYRIREKCRINRLPFM